MTQEVTSVDAVALGDSPADATETSATATDQGALRVTRELRRRAELGAEPNPTVTSDVIDSDND